MPTRAKSRFWRRCRIYFRRFRIFTWLILLALLGALVHLNLVGLPDFLKRPLLETLRQRGVALEFAHLRLHWTGGFVAGGVRFGSMDDPSIPRLVAEEVEIRLQPAALLRGRLQVDSLTLHGGRLEWQPPETIASLQALTVEDIETELRFLPDDEWRLDDFHARFAGADFLIAASITNASAIRDWPVFHEEVADPSSRWPLRLSRLADTLESITFAQPPELRLVVDGDARALNSFSARLNLKAAHADTPWGQAGQVAVQARVFPNASNELSRAEITLSALDAQTRWANVTNLDLQLRLTSFVTSPERVNASLTLRAASAETPWANVSRAQLKAHSIHALTNPVPLSGRVELAADQVSSRRVRADAVHVSAMMATREDTPATDAGWAGWARIAPYQFDWTADAGALKADQFDAESVHCAGRWDAPGLDLRELRARLYRGAIDARARLDAATREFSFDAESDFDVKRFSPLLTEKAREWLANFSWDAPPRLRATGVLTLPAWTNQSPDWQADIRPTVRLAGEVTLDNAAFRGIRSGWTRASFTYTNLVWHLPDLEARLPDGRLRLALTSSDVTRDFHFRLHSDLFPRVTLPLLDEKARHGLDLCGFGAPPVIRGDLWGRWHEPDRIGFRGSVELTNFSFRGQSADALVTELDYTNRVIECISPQVWRGTQTVSAAGIRVDFPAMRMFITNGFSTIEPRVVTRAIGPVVDKVMEPYRFLDPPTVRINGFVPMRNPRDADVRFDCVAGGFSSWKFNVPRAAALVHWLDNTLTVTNATADFYGGAVDGWARFVFEDGHGAEFAFGANVTNASLRRLMADVAPTTNHLDGALTVQLTVTNAYTDDWDSWHGHGRARLRDGLIWQVPIFGVLSRPLDAIFPGIGNSPVTEGTARFGIVRSVISTDNLEMRAPTMRLQYRGTVDFNAMVKARVTAEPLRDTWLIGTVVSKALWPVAKIFEYKITGTLREPEAEPLYIPKILMLPISPFRTLEELFKPGPVVPDAPPPEPR